MLKVRLDKVFEGRAQAKKKPVANERVSESLTSNASATNQFTNTKRESQGSFLILLDNGLPSNEEINQRVGVGDAIVVLHLLKKGNPIMDKLIAASPMVGGLVMEGREERVVKGLRKSIPFWSGGSLAVDIFPDRCAKAGGQHDVPFRVLGWVTIEFGEGQ
jgi:hypothetical protein